MVEKKIKGRKRQIAVDTQGNLQEVYVHSAQEHDSKGGCVLVHCLQSSLPNVKNFCGDAGYRGLFVNFIEQLLSGKVHISKHIAESFAVIPKRWAVERTFAWLGNFHRLAKDFEINSITSENMIRMASISMALKYLNKS